VETTRRIPSGVEHRNGRPNGGGAPGAGSGPDADGRHAAAAEQLERAALRAALSAHPLSPPFAALEDLALRAGYYAAKIIRGIRARICLGYFPDQRGPL